MCANTQRISEFQRTRTTYIASEKVTSDTSRIGLHLSGRAHEMHAHKQHRSDA